MNGVDIEMIESDSHCGQIRVRSAAVGDGYFPNLDEKNWMAKNLCRTTCSLRHPMAGKSSVEYPI